MRVVLHNICIDMDDKAISNWDVGFDQRTNRRTPLVEIRDLFHMAECSKTPDACINAASIRDFLKNKFWQERQECDVATLVEHINYTCQKCSLHYED